MPTNLLLRRVSRHLYALLRSGRIGGERSASGLGALVQRWARRAHIPYEELGGKRTLAGSYSASGRNNEFDAVLGRSPEVIVIELKNWRFEVPTEEPMLLLQKALDHWVARSPTLAPIYPMMTVSSSLTDDARRFCFIWGIVPIEPDLVPPTLLLELFDEFEEARSLVSEGDRRRATELFVPFFRGITDQIGWLMDHRGFEVRASLTERLDFQVSLSATLRDWFESDAGPLRSWISRIETLIR